MCIDALMKNNTCIYIMTIGEYLDLQTAHWMYTHYVHVDRSVNSEVFSLGRCGKDGRAVGFEPVITSK